MNKSNITGKLWLMSILFGIMALLSSCEEDYKLELPLAVAQNELNLGAGGGSTHVLVYCTGDWTATLKDPADASWATIEKASGNENGEFIFNYAINPGIQRKAVIVINSGSNTEEIEMVQSGYLNSPELVLAKEALTLPDWATNPTLGFETNMGLAIERIKTKVEYTIDGETFTPADAENPGWLTDVTVNEDFVNFKTLENTDGVGRVARITVSVYDNVAKKNHTASCIVTQQSEGGYIRFENNDTPAEVESFAKDVTFPWATNMEMFFDAMTVTVTYDEPGEEWVSNITLQPDGLHTSILESTYNGERHATVTVTYNGPEGTVTATRKVVQAEPSIEVPYADIRALLTSAGTTTLDRNYIMARVASDPANPNSDTNTQSAWNAVDLTESTRTAYIQSLDGQYGFRVKLATGEDPNCLPRYAVLKIALAGLTIEREDNPARYTIRDFKAASILESTPGNESDLMSKKKHINQLTDDDINTFVVLTDMEVAVPCGSWANFHNGYATKTDLISVGAAAAQRDGAVRFFRDINGSTIPMLFNAQCPWRYSEAAIPTGSGTVGAMVVHSPFGFHNANNEMGRYQIRPLARKDINLESTSAFSQTIALWKWDTAADIIRPNASAEPTKVKANKGEGFMSTNAVLGKDCNVLTGSFYCTAFSQKNLSKSFYYCAKWWDFAAASGSRGKAITWEFSTKGISGRNLSLCLTGGGGYQNLNDGKVPTEWNIEYSTDGVNFTQLKKKWIFYPTATWNYQAMDCPAGNAEHIFDLPDSLFGHDKVYVRMKVASKLTMHQTKGVTGANLRDNDAADNAKRYLRFECISIKYNK